MPNLDLMARLTAIQQSLVSLRACTAPDGHTQIDQLTEDLRAVTADVQARLTTQSPLRDNYAALFNNHHSVMLLIEPDSGQIVDANPAACAYYGYSRALLISKNIADINILPPHEIRAEMQRAQQFKKNFFNFRHRLASGEIRDVEVRSDTITLDDQPFLYSIIHDVTDRRRAEEALQRSEEKYRRLFNSAQVGIFRSSIAEGRLLEANQKLAQMFGYEHPDDMRATFLSVSHYVNPADRIRLLTELKDDGTYLTFEIPFLRRNGSQLWALMEARKDVAAQCIEGVMLDITAHRLTADALIDSEVRNRSIVEALSEGILLQQSTGEIVFANASAAQILGLTHEDLVGRASLDPRGRLIFPDGSPMPVDAHPGMVTLRTGQPVRGVLAGVLKPDLTYAWLSVNAEPMFRANTPEPYAVVTSFVDVTERVQAEARLHQINEDLEQRVLERTAALQTSEANYRDLIENTVDWVWQIDQDGCYIYASPQVRDLLGYEPHDILGRTPFDLMPPDEAQRLAPVFANFAQQHQPFVGLENRARHRDGHDVVLETNGTPVIGEHGEFLGYRGTDRDITQRKRTEEALRASEEQLQLVLEATRDGFWDLDLPTNDLYVSPRLAEMLGYKAKEIETSLDFWSRLVHPEDWLATQDATAAHFTGLTPTLEIELRIRNKAGNWWWGHTRGKVVSRDAAGRPKRFVGMMTDITDRKQAEVKLRALLDAIPDIMFVNRLDGLYVDYHASARASLAMPPEMFLGKHPTEVLPSEIVPLAMAQFERVVHTGQPVTYDYQMILNGITRNFEARLVMCGPQEVLTIVRDITARKQAEDALRQSEERYRGLIESQTDLIVRVDPAGAFTYVNDAYCAMFGQSRQELLSGTFMPLVHPDDLPATLKAMEGLSTPPYRVQIEQRAQAVNGWRWFSWEDYAIHDEYGAIIEIQAVGRDITERKQAEMRLRALLDAIPDMMFLNSADGIYLDYHAPRAAVLAAPPEVFLGKHMREVLPPDLCTEFEAAITQVRQQDSSITHEYTLVIQDQPHQFEARLVKCGTDEVLTVVRDVTERKRSEEALRQSAENYRNLFENASVGIFHSLPEGRFLRVNSTLAHMLGYASPDEMVAAITDIGTQLYLDSNRRMNLLKATLQREGWVYAENRYRRKDGSILIGTLAVRQVRKPDGSLAYLEGFIEDITERRHAEDALRESETLYHTLVETLPMNIFRKDRAGHFTFVNSLFSQTEGRSPAEILGKTDLDLHPAELAQKYREDDERVMLSGHPLNLVEVRQSLGSPPIYVQTIKTPLYDAADNLIGIQGVFWDISPLKRAEVALRESEARYRALFEAADDAIFVSRVRDGIADEIIAVNDVACTRLGYTHEELLTASVSQYDSMEHMEQLGPVSKQLCTAGRARFERVHVARNGRRIPVEISARQFELNGEEVVLSIVRDITERKWAEAALRESEARYRALFDGANDAIFMHRVGPDGLPDAVIAVNHVACQWLGYTREELLKAPLGQYDTMENLEVAQQAVDQLRTAGHATFERMYVARNGRRFPVEINSRRFEFNDEVVYLAVLRDITERKQVEEALQQSLQHERELNLMKTQFVSMVSHEFRTPLTAIQSTSDLLMHYSQRFSEEKKHDYLERIQAAVKRMTTMLDEVLVLGRAESGKLDFNPAPIDLEWFCRALVDEFQLSAGEAYTLNFEFKNGCQEPNLDESLLRHILTNLLSNAIKYSPAGGVIDFSVTCDGGQVAFRVADHGIGIPPEEQARLFETFYRASNVGSIQGTGLGLSIVKRAVDLHQGTITVDSNPGHGTTFDVRLPFVEA